MIDKPKQGTSNLSVLGILIRTTRMAKGYSLRDLASITNISHTLISNIEKGKQTPSESTLSDIFDALELRYYDDKEINEEISYYYRNIMLHLINHDYHLAGNLVEEMMKKEDIYLFSNEMISYLIAKLLYFALRNLYVENREELIQQYEQVYEFLTDEQKQMFCLIRGLDLLNDDYYLQASDFFLQALKLGNKDWDPFIKEYHSRSLIRQYKFTDTQYFAREAIEEFEQRTIYLRAMKCRLLMARVYLHIMNFDKVKELVEYVELFATKFNVDVLTDECKLIKAWMHFINKDYDLAIQQIDSTSRPDASHLILPRFRIYLEQKDEKLLDFYKEVISTRKVELTRKKFLLIQVLMMWQVPEVKNDKVYIKSLKELNELAVHIKDQENITLSFNLLILYFKENKRYKKALEIAEEFLQIKKIGI